MSTAGQGQFVIGSYRVGQSIGEGTFGKVRLGVHMGTEERVAVKTLQKQKIVQQADIERVTRQICILKILRHPNIIQLYEIIETKTDIHLIMEYAPGGELFDYIVKKKRLDELEAVAFMQQIFSGVEYIHKNGIVHRDLKPENLLFDEHRNIKIVDFGLSNQYKPGEKLKTACGSPCYAAPEMIAGKRYECLNVDVWSCGIILYAMLCGYLPFEDQNTNKLYKKIMSGDYEQPKVLTPDSKDILRHLLDVNPETRYKISQVRESRWYGLTKKRYEAQGIVVGSDIIQPDEQVVYTMRKMGVNMDPVQIKNYIVNNRHNHITAFYYLLKKKAEKHPQILLFEPRTIQPKTVQNRTVEPRAVESRTADDMRLTERQQKTAEKEQRQTIEKEQGGAEKEQKVERQQRAEKEEKRSNSPLIYKPEQKKEFYMPIKKASMNESKDNTRVNDSFNASTIVSSLIEANKNKLMNINNAQRPIKKLQTFDKTEQFKLFPKPKTASIYETPSSITNSPLSLSINPQSHSKPSPFTTRTETEEKKYSFVTRPDSDNKNKPELQDHTAKLRQRQTKDETQSNIVIAEKRPTARESSPIKEDLQIKNKRREELSDQLKQISLKIDKQIQQLRKHNNGAPNPNPTEKRRQSFTFGMQPLTKLKSNDQSLTTQPQPSNVNKSLVFPQSQSRPVTANDKQPLPPSLPHSQAGGHEGEAGENSKISYFKQTVNKFPKMHFGPFNAQCLFMQAPRNITLKIEEFLSRAKTIFKEIDPFTVRLQSNETVSVESIHGLGGYHVVKFSSYSPLSDAIIDFLSQ